MAPDGPKGLSLGMDYVEGRQVKTYASTKEDGTIVLDGHLFDRDRGDFMPVFERAKEILDHVDEAAALPAEMTSTQYQFKGENLDIILGEYGYKRNEGETDEDFRKRIFPSMFLKDEIKAAEVMIGKHVPEWEPVEMLVYEMLLSRWEKNQNQEDLHVFANGVIKGQRQQKEDQEKFPFL